MEQGTCEHCKAVFVFGRQATQRFCTSTCQRRASRARLGEGYPERQCEACDRPYRPSRKDQRVCGLACRFFIDPRQPKQSDLLWRECRDCGEWFVSRVGYQRCRACPTCRTRTRTSPERQWIAGDCRRCGKPFVLLVRRPAQLATRYCSVQCKQSDGGSRRRGAQRMATVGVVVRWQVFERDRWRCQLCGKMIKRSVAVPHPLAATLDHVIPLAAGGTHEPANVQAAHFRCNSFKSDGFWQDGEQLRLLG